MADVKIIDIDGEQWNMKDQDARNDIKEILNKRSEILNATFRGTVDFQAKMRYIGEDTNYVYHLFWWEPQEKIISGAPDFLLVFPPNESSDKILTLNLNILQDQNSNIITKTQHPTGPNKSGMTTYIGNVTNNTNWTISGIGILRRIK